MAGQPSRQSIVLDKLGQVERKRLPVGASLRYRKTLMRIVAIETSESVGSVAALSGEDTLIERPLPPEKGTASSLAPAIQEILRQVGWHPSQIQGIGVTIGPGSFTGLRVGVTTAKTLAYATQALVAGVDSFDAIAAACPPEVPHLAVAIDGQQGQIVCGTFHRGSNGELAADGPWQLVDQDAWLESLPAGIAVAGSALRRLSGKLPRGVAALDSRFWTPTASLVGRIAARRFARGDCDDLWALVPRYHRRSAAEERWDRRQKKDQPG